MSEPFVVCVMLTRNRPEMARRAIRSFNAQTYEHRRLIIVNSGAELIIERETERVWEPPFVGLDAHSIGEIRNHACKYAAHHYVHWNEQPEIVCHWDDDDWSHPNRIAEQVHLLSGKVECTGYYDMLYHRVIPVSEREAGMGSTDRCCDVLTEVWKYSCPTPSFMMGTSLCYTRKLWERNPFPDSSEGEDLTFINRLSLGERYGVSSMQTQPRMIATANMANPAVKIPPQGDDEKRAWQPVTDASYRAYVEERMKL